MIDTQVSIHDKFSVELKIGFITKNKAEEENEFKINTWIFIPNGLDINRVTYSKEQFYTDIKSNIRLNSGILFIRHINGYGSFPTFIPGN